MSVQGEHAWLESVDGPEALSWVKERNAETLKVLGDPRESETYAKALACLESKEKIPYVRKIGSKYYNYWTDSSHPRGIMRRVDPKDFEAESPPWETVLDVDALGTEESESWVWKGQTVLKEKERSMVALSPGGSDAVVRREFDLPSKEFVEGGFSTPLGKSRVSWVDIDTLLIGVHLNDGDSTTSGYPRVVREWKRGTKLEDAPIVFEGQASDVSVGGSVVRSQGFEYEFRSRGVSFYSSKRQVRRHNAQRDGTWIDLSTILPDDCGISIYADNFLVELRSEWNGFVAGSLLVVNFDDLSTKGSEADFGTVFEPTPSTSLAGSAATKDFLILNVLEDVKSRLVFIDRATWTVVKEDDAKIRQVGISPVDSDESNDYFSTVSSFLTPPTLRLNNERDLKSLPRMFDADKHTETQRFATSRDGTRVPYFLVGNSDPSMPCLLYAYGGFEISQTPSYSSTIGAGWLQRGGNFVVANIRGGGEYGPEWHKAALRENRQRAYDDLHAVAQDLVRTNVVNSASQIGVRGGSNGGLLVGNAYVQRPDLYGAVVCAVPLLDMKRFSHLLAGASWQEEYGNPDTSDWDDFLKKYSPYHQIDPENAEGEGQNIYPPILLTTSTRDDRVHPYHARAFVHRLNDIGIPNVFYYENIEGGHGGAADAKQSAYVTALYQDFLFDVLRPTPQSPQTPSSESPEAS